VSRPGQKIFLHFAVTDFGAAAWDIHRSMTTTAHEHRHFSVRGALEVGVTESARLLMIR
jgi:hypothetical protein